MISRRTLIVYGRHVAYSDFWRKHLMIHQTINHGESYVNSLKLHEPFNGCPSEMILKFLLDHVSMHRFLYRYLAHSNHLSDFFACVMLDTRVPIPPPTQPPYLDFTQNLEPPPTMSPLSVA